MSNGIDLNRSGWENPEGFEKAPRQSLPVAAVEACEAPGPDGWVCDLNPGHTPTDQHYADDGGQGVRWRGAMVDVSKMSDQEPVLIPAYSKPERLDDDPRERIAAIAEMALQSQSPAAWAVALDKILSVARGERLL